MCDKNCVRNEESGKEERGKVEKRSRGKEEQRKRGKEEKRKRGKEERRKGGKAEKSMQRVSLQMELSVQWKIARVQLQKYFSLKVPIDLRTSQPLKLKDSLSDFEMNHARGDQQQCPRMRRRKRKARSIYSSSPQMKPTGPYNVK